jgi:hypothetical protein
MTKKKKKVNIILQKSKEIYLILRIKVKNRVLKAKEAKKEWIYFK